MADIAPSRARTDFDVILIGTGSGNSIFTPDFENRRIAIIEKDLFGGTCLNRGCIPTKMFVYAADVATSVRHASTYGVDASVDNVRWPDIVKRIFGRIDPIPPDGKAYREMASNTTVFTGEARFIGPKEIEVALADGSRQHLTGATIVIAAGGHPYIPDVKGLDDVMFHTSDTVMRVPALPARLIILGGGYIASEMAHVFASLGSKVIIVNRSNRLLTREDEAVSKRFTELYVDRYECHMNARVDAVRQAGGPAGEIVVELHSEERMWDIAGDALMVAVGRQPSTAALNLMAAGVAVDVDGYITTDPYMRTNVDGIWALGDITNRNQLKHTANAEARAVAHNIIHLDDQRIADLWPIPHAVFADPQVASVGCTEQELRTAGRTYITATQDYSGVAYGWAMEDTKHFCKVIADPETRLLLGAHIIGPQASILIQQLIQGMKFGQTIDEMAKGQLYIHPALTEVVENALLTLTTATVGVTPPSAPAATHV
ncbi:MAG: mycothione reductase [Ilumatobacteraceae bacterium]